MDLIMLKDIMKSLLIMFLLLIVIWGILVGIEAIRCFNYKKPMILVLSIMTDTIYSSEGIRTDYECLGYGVSILRREEDSEIIEISMYVLNKHLFTRNKIEKSPKESTNSNLNFRREYENINDKKNINIYNSVESEN